MMRLKLYLKKLAKRALKLLIVTYLIYGCTSSTSPTYLKENINEAIQNICKKEHNLDVKVKLFGETLWVYLPTKDMITAADKKDKPQKNIERFAIEHNQDTLQDNFLKLEYAIKVVPEKEKSQDYKYNEEVFKNINHVLSAIRRVLFSMDRSKAKEPKFFYLVVTDIGNGFEMRELSYYLDFKKFSYGLLSQGEYLHRIIDEFNIVPQATGDEEGLYITYMDISMGEFIAKQIQHRILLKFQKPEVDKNVDIDKEILKIVAYTVKAYDFKDFDTAELNNLLTQNKIVLNRLAIWARPTD